MQVPKFNNEAWHHYQNKYSYYKTDYKIFNLLIFTSFIKMLGYKNILYNYFMQFLKCPERTPKAISPTITEDSMSEEVKMSLPFHWVLPLRYPLDTSI